MNEIRIRLATLAEADQLELLIARSVRSLQAADYTARQMEAALGSVFGIDRQLIRDGTYYAAEVRGNVAGCGGWSRRKTLFGSDHSPVRNDGWLDPAHDAARIRAFFVDPDCARQGVGSRLLEHCEQAASAFGFQRLELAATLTGERLFRNRGYAAIAQIEVHLPGGITLPVIRMQKRIG